MAENKATGRDAMSRALGAAFLSHRVEELEKTVSTSGPGAYSVGPQQRDRDGRDRRGSHGGGGRGRGGPRQARGGGARPRSNDADMRDRDRKSADEERNSDQDDRDRDGGRTAGRKEKDADVVVADASVLVHALGQLKAWCRNGREEVVVVPLEALNTLDLLKKGTSPIAQRARAASRILEAQVGVNPRIKVQRDDAFVPWDEIPFNAELDSGDIGPGNNKGNVDAGVTEEKTTPAPQTTPEWLRRTICCARWEFEQAAKASSTTEASLVDNTQARDEAARDTTADTKPAVPRAPLLVTVAVCLEPAQLPDTTSAPSTSPVPSAPISTSPVPLPMTFPASQSHPGPGTKHEPRAAGTLVAHWARAAGVRVTECRPTPLPVHGAPPAGRGRGTGLGGHMRSSSDEEWRAPGKASGGAVRNAFRPVSAEPSKGERSRPIVYGPGRGRGGDRGSGIGRGIGVGVGAGGSGEALVERPMATMTMNASMLQPRKVIRVLARGEKLEP